MALLVRCTRGQTHESMHRPQKMGLAAVYTKCKWIHRSVLSIHSRRLAGPTENYHSFFLLNLSFDRCFAVDVEKWNIGWVFFFFKTIAHVHFLHFVVHSNRTCAPAKCVLRDVWVIYLRIDTDRYIAFYFNQFLSFFFCILSVVSLRRLQLITAVGAVLQSNSLTSIVYNAGWCPEHARQYSQVEIKYVWLVLSVVLGRFFCLSVNLFAYPHSYVPNAPSVVVQLVRWFVALSHTQTQPQTLEHCIRIDHFGWQHQHQFYVLRISIRGVPWTESLIFFNYNMVNVDRCCGDGRLKMRSVCRYRYHILHKHSNRILIDCRELENWFRKLTCVVCMLAGQWQYTVNGSFFFLFVFNIHFLTRSLLARLNKICSMWSLIGRRGVECRATWPAVEACFRWFIEIYSKRINNAGQCDRQQQPSITLYM